MTLPKNDAEHLKTLIMRLHNPQVKRHFKDAPDDDIVTQGPASIKAGCTVKNSDSLLIAIARCWIFEVIVQNARAMHPPLYATPVGQHYQQMEFDDKPKVVLLFEQDVLAVANGFSKLQAEITFRLMNES